MLTENSAFGVLRQCPRTIQFKSQHRWEPKTNFLAFTREANPTLGVHEAAYRALLVRLHEHPNFVQHRSVYGNSLHIATSIMAVVPQFQGVFHSFDAQLPAFTLWVIALSQGLQTYGLWLLGILGVTLAGLRHRYKHSSALRQRVDGWLLKLPVIGNLLHMSAMARFSRTLSTTLTAGVPLLEALNSVASATGNIVYKEAVLRLKQQVATGSQIHLAMSVAGIFPGMAIQMTAIGEESGTLDSMLDHVAAYYEGEVDTLVDNLTTLMEPVIMVVLGVMVGGLVIAMYLPIFNLGRVI